MNILSISYDYPPYEGGVAHIAYQAICQLDRMGEKVIVVAQKTKGDKAFDKNNKFLTYRRINIFFLRELGLILLLPYLVIKHKIDIIYMLIWHQGGIATFLTSKFLNIPYVLHAYGEEFIDYKRTLFDKIKYSTFREKYKRLIFKNAKRIIAISNFTKGIIIKSGTAENKIEVVYCGVDTNIFRPDLETNAIIEKYKLYNKRILLTVARLSEYKGQDTIIKLMPQLLEKIPNLVYIIVGWWGKDREYLRSLVKKLDLQNNVIFAGYIDPGYVNSSSLPLYYNACDIYIMLTKERLERGEFEGYGLVYLEANSCCKPVIGTRTGGVAEAIIDGKTGYLVDTYDNQGIIDKIILLLENRELARAIGEEGRRRIIKETLVWESTGRKIQDILASEIEKK